MGTRERLLTFYSLSTLASLRESRTQNEPAARAAVVVFSSLISLPATQGMASSATNLPSPPVAQLAHALRSRTHNELKCLFDQGVLPVKQTRQPRIHWHLCHAVPSRIHGAPVPGPKHSHRPP